MPRIVPKLRVLVACEYSGRVRDAFAKKGHDAWSCDIIPSETKGNHFLGDVRQHLDKGWDVMVAHPPCTHLSVSGARWLVDGWVTQKSHPDGRYWYDGSEKRELQKDGLQFVLDLMNAPIPQICIENPVSVISTKIGKPTQIIQPWMFGHEHMKTTCLWLKNLAELEPTHIVDKGHNELHLLPPSADRGKKRSLTYQGIADAMAAQWGDRKDRWGDPIRKEWHSRPWGRELK